MLSRASSLILPAVAALLLPQTTLGGSFIISGSSCWCDQVLAEQDWYAFPVLYVPTTGEECLLTRVAFRIQGTPDDPAYMRRFEPLLFGSATGDPFGAGVVIAGLDPFPGDTAVGYIYIFISSALAPQTWSVQPHNGIPGFTAPLAEFEASPGTWVLQVGHSTLVGSTTPQCNCPDLTPHTCPFAVEPRTWSMVKRTFE